MVGIIYYYASYNSKISQSSQPKEVPVVLPEIQNKVFCQPANMECIINNLINNFKNDCIPIELIISPEEGGLSEPVIVGIYGYIGDKCYYRTKGTTPELNCAFKKEYVTETTIRGLLGMGGIPDTQEFQKIKSESCK